MALGDLAADPAAHRPDQAARPKGKDYDEIWNKQRNEGPLLTTTRAQAEKLAARMAAKHGDRVMVDFCMRYGNPSTDAAIRRLKDEGCERILFFPLYPQYAAATTATANDHAFRTLMKMRWQPAFRTTPAYHDEPTYIDALAKSVERHMADRATEPDVLVASFHGIPQSYFRQGRPLSLPLPEDRAVAARAPRLARGAAACDLPVPFRARGVAQAYTVEHVAELAKSGKKDIAVIAPGFSADCLETLEEINGEIAKRSRKPAARPSATCPALTMTTRIST